MNCGYCQRSKEKIVGSIVHEKKFNHRTSIEVLYKSSQNHLACARCVCELDIIRQNDGEPVVTYKPKEQKYFINTKALKTVKTEPYVFEAELSLPSAR